MFNQTTLALVFALIIKVIFLNCGIYHYSIDKNNKFKLFYLATTISSYFWALFIALMNMSSDVYVALFWRNCAAVFWVLLFPFITSLYIYMSDRAEQFSQQFKLRRLIYLPSLFYYYLIFFVFPYTKEDMIFTRFGWSYINKAPYNADIFFPIYAAFYIIILFIVMIDYHKKAKFQRQIKAIHLIALATILAFSIGIISDILIPIIDGIYFIPIAYAAHLLIIFAVGYVSKNYLLTTLDSDIFLPEVSRNVDEGILITDPDGKIGFVNKKALCYIEPSLEKNLSNFRLPDDIDKILNKFYNFELEEISYDNKRMIITDKHQNKQYFEIRITSIKDKFDEEIAKVHLLQDRTKMAETELALTNAKEMLESEINKRTLSLNEKTNSLSKEVKRRELAEKRISWLAYNDALTRLNNLAKLTSDISALCAENDLSKTHALIYIDIDNFKFINENLGRDIGDVYLRNIAQTITENSGENTNCYRVGGDEFAILIKDLESEERINQLIKQLHATFSKQQNFSNLRISINFSAGTAYYPQHATNANSLIYRAEVAMIESKKNSLNKNKIYQKSYEIEMTEKVKLIEDMKDALLKNNFVLHYQPQVEYVDGECQIVGLEALLRWRQPNGKLLMPGDFIEVAESSGTIIEIGQFVIKQAIKDLSQLKKDYGKELTIAINISPNQFLDDNLINILLDAIEANHINPSLVEVELTERMLVNSFNHSNKKLHQIKNVGIHISIDDFGIEYSSLNYLKQLPVDKIKLDMSFIRGIGISAKDEAIIETLISLGHKLDLRMLSEGIESAEHIDFLSQLSKDMIYQGYYFYKPMPFIEIIHPDNLAKMKNEKKLNI